MKTRPSKAEYEEELLDSDFNNLTKAFTGGDDEDHLRQQALAKKLAEH